jgi:type II secretion system protein N
MSRRIPYLYGLFFIGVTAIWMYVQFPARAVEAYAVQKVAGLVPELNLAVAEVALSFPAAVRFDGVSVQYQGEPALNLDRLRLRPGWKTLLPGKAVFGFQAEIGEGKAGGRVELSTRPEFSTDFLSLDLDSVQVANLPILVRRAGRELAGLCNGELHYTSEDPPAAMKGRLVLENGRVEVRLPMIKRQSLSFAKIESEIDIKGRSLTLRRLVWQGPELDGEFSGTVEIKSPLETSQIELLGNMLLHPAFLTELHQTIPQRLMPKPGPGGRYGVQFSGTLANPRYRLR